MDLAKVSANQKEPEGWRIGVFRDGWESDIAGWLETSAHGGENDGEQGRRKSCRGLELGKNRGGAGVWGEVELHANRQRLPTQCFPWGSNMICFTC